MANIEKTVTKIVGFYLGLPAGTVRLDAHIVDDLGADWLDREELIMTIEESFGLCIPSADAVQIQRISDIVEYLKKVVPYSRTTDEDQS